MRQRGFLEILGALVLGGLVVVAVAGAAVMGSGSMKVDVQMKGTSPAHVVLPVPVNLVRFGLNFVPENELDQVRGELEPWMPLIRAVLAELEKAPDGTLVEVESGDETVHIVKRGEELVVDVDTAEESVHVAAPVAGIGTLLEKLYGPGPSV